MENGLPVNDIYGLAQDDKKNLWIATTSGLFRMNTKNKTLVAFDEEDGLLAKDFGYNILRLHDGRMAVPAHTGFVYFSPDKISVLSIPPDVRITGFKIFDNSLLIDSVLHANKTVELNHEENFISISYASLSFSGRNNTQYFYQPK